MPNDLCPSRDHGPHIFEQGKCALCDAPMPQRTFTGYLTAVKNPSFSGLATVHVRSRKMPTKRKQPTTDARMVELGYSTYDVGTVHTFVVDAGSGVRFLANIFDRFSVEGQHTKARFTVDDLGMLSHVTLVEA